MITPPTLRLPAIVPVPFKVPADAMRTSPVPVGDAPAIESVPDATVVPPLYVLAPVKIVVPVPLNVNPPTPEKIPDRVAEPPLGDVIVPPALDTVKAKLELSPLPSTNVPPARTGFAVPPTLLKLTLVPAPMLDVLDVLSLLSPPL